MIQCGVLLVDAKLKERACVYGTLLEVNSIQVFSHMQVMPLSPGLERSQMPSAKSSCFP